MLAGIYSSLLDLLGRVTVARAAKLDNVLTNATWTDARAGKLDALDAAVSTRAAAATALSTAQWTNARAALVDRLGYQAGPATVAPLSALIGGGVLSGSSIPRTNFSAAAADTWHEVVNVTGSGVALLAAVICSQVNATVSLRITTDGVPITKTEMLSNNGLVLIGAAGSSSGISLEAWPFKTSLKIEVMRAGFTFSGDVYYKYRLGA